VFYNMIWNQTEQLSHVVELTWTTRRQMDVSVMMMMVMMETVSEEDSSAKKHSTVL